MPGYVRIESYAVFLVWILYLYLKGWFTVNESEGEFALRYLLDFVRSVLMYYSQVTSLSRSLSVSVNQLLCVKFKSVGQYEHCDLRHDTSEMTKTFVCKYYCVLWSKWILHQFNTALHVLIYESASSIVSTFQVSIFKHLLKIKCWIPFILLIFHSFWKTTGFLGNLGY